MVSVARGRKALLPAISIGVLLHEDRALEERPMTDLVLLERQGEIAKVMLNQPAKLNAVNNRCGPGCARSSSSSMPTTACAA